MTPLPAGLGTMGWWVVLVLIVHLASCARQLASLHNKKDNEVSVSTWSNVTMMRVLVPLLGILWASPYTLLGLCLGGVGVCTGGRARIRGRAIEFYGGGVKWFVTHLPLGQFTLAITLGHTILGQSDASLDISRDHEMVHVRQFERWGPLMGPAYLLASLVLWTSGRRPYRDNPFEREAYDEGGGD
jgi:hypothetical protein